jgi:hypothetical protein
VNHDAEEQRIFRVFRQRLIEDIKCGGPNDCPKIITKDKKGRVKVRRMTMEDLKNA